MKIAEDAERRRLREEAEEAEAEAMALAKETRDAARFHFGCAGCFSRRGSVPSIPRWWTLGADGRIRTRPPPSLVRRAADAATCACSGRTTARGATRS